jgi:predicted ester cyclase
MNGLSDHVPKKKSLGERRRVTTYKTYHGTHEGRLPGIAPTHRKVHFDAVDVMRVHNGKITDAARA